MNAPDFEQSLQWCQAGTRWFVNELAALDADELAKPSLLPQWDRAHVAAHVINNADALGNLVHWASTGEPTPMYASAEQRTADIERVAQLPPQELRDRVVSSAMALGEALVALTPEQRSATVGTMHTAALPAAMIPWLRAREAMIHTVDLASGAEFDEMPPDFLMALIADVVSARSARPKHPALLLQVSSENRYRDEDELMEFVVSGVGEPVLVQGSAPDVAAYLTGRNTQAGPPLPAWL